MPNTVSNGRGRIGELLDQDARPVQTPQVAEAGITTQEMGLEGDRILLRAARERVQEEERALLGPIARGVAIAGEVVVARADPVSSHGPGLIRERNGARREFHGIRLRRQAGSGPGEAW